MKEKLKALYRILLMFLPTKVVLHFENFRGYHKFGDFKKPKFFGEKIQWLKLNGNLEKYTELVDKYLVRDYVEEKVDKSLLIPLLGVYNNSSEIDFDSLPEQFVIKINNGSGFNIIVKNKNEINKEQVCKKLNKWLKVDYYKIKKEPQYKYVNRKIIIEKYVANKEGKLLDYKFFCFNGEPKIVEVDFERFENHKMNFYDMNWNLLDLKKGKHDNYRGNVDKPENFEKMVEYAKKLSKDFDFVRVDLYNVDGTIYFGELTFTPAGGLTKFNPISEDIKYASMIKTCEKRKVLLIASTSRRRNRLDGVTVKSRVLEQYLLNQKDISLKTIDSDEYKTKFIPISFSIIWNLIQTNKIVICSSSPGAAKLLHFLRLIKSRIDIYYFVAGGVIGDKIESGTYNLKNYVGIKKIYVESNELKEQLMKIGLNNVEQMNNFRYIKNFKSSYEENSNTFKTVFWARVNQQKGVEECIDVVKKVSQVDKINITLDIYGQCKEEYLNVISKSFSDNIKYKGAITPNNKKEYEILSQYDILLFPTRYYNEGLPGTIIDSYVSSLAVIASNWKYAKEYIKNGENGLIFEFDNCEDFYIKLKEMLNKETIKKYKEKSGKMFEYFKAENVLSDFYEDLIK